MNNLVKYIGVTLICITLGIHQDSFSQVKADDIIGYYYVVDPFSKEESQSYIYKNEDGTYCGKICWVGNKEKTHHLDFTFMKGLTFNAKNEEWENGVIKYPGKKGTYKASMKIEGNKVKMRGYWGVSMLGKTVYWIKEEKKRLDSPS